MFVEHKINGIHSITFLIGSQSDPCLYAEIKVANRTGNQRMNIQINKGIIYNIASNKSCALGEHITEDYMEKYSMGREILETILYYIHSNYPAIKGIKLNDMSFIPCSPVETLDLLTYSIALYGKTWYEQKMGAYIENKQKYTMYQARVERYMSKETKASLSWSDIYNKMKSKEGTYMSEMLQKNYAEWEELFNKSETLPMFFIELSKYIPRAKKCIFFKGWLEAMITSYISPIERSWMIDVDPLIDAIRANGIPTFEEMEKSGGYLRKKNTRKRKHSVRRYRRTSRHQTG
jgi:hypothetical protein